MAIKLDFGFERTATEPIDASQTLSKAEMLAIDDTKMPDVYFAVCKDDKKMYVYDKSATPSAETGKFTVVNGGGSGTVIVGSEWGVVNTQSIPRVLAGNTLNVNISGLGLSSVDDYSVSVDTISNGEIYPAATLRVVSRTATSFGIKNTSTTTNFGAMVTVIAKGYGSTPSGGTTGQVLTKKSNADGDVEWADGGSGGGNLPMTKTTLWETNDYTTNPATITLSDSIMNYDMLYLYGWHYDQKENVCTTLYLNDIWHNNRRLGISTNSDAYVWYDWVSNTELAKASEQNFAIVKVVGVKFGSSLDGTIGRWEKIGEDLTGGAPADFTVKDLSEYNMLSFAVRRSGNYGWYNSAVISTADYGVGDQVAINGPAGSNLEVWIKKVNDTTLNRSYVDGNAATGVRVYGYKEAAITDADAQRIANNVPAAHLTGSRNNGELKGMILSDDNKELRVFDDGRIIMIDGNETLGFNLLKLNTDTLDSLLYNSNEATDKTITLKNSTDNGTMEIDSFSVTQRFDDGAGLGNFAQLSGGTLQMSETNADSDNTAYIGPKHMSLSSVDSNGDPLNHFTMEWSDVANVDMSDDLKAAWRTALDVGSGGKTYNGGAGITVDNVNNTISMNGNAYSVTGKIENDNGGYLFTTPNDNYLTVFVYGDSVEFNDSIGGFTTIVRQTEIINDTDWSALWQ